MMISAWEAGLDGAAIPGMTPAEVNGMFKALSVRKKQEAAQMDRMAWLFGSYNRAAYHAKRYPNKPKNADKIDKPASRIMTDEEMKNVMLANARMWNK